jgi:hypothetical protein
MTVDRTGLRVTARGNHRDGYAGFIDIGFRSGPIPFECGHKHAGTADARDCIRKLVWRLLDANDIAALGSPSTGDAESEEQRRIEQAYIDGSVEGSPIDHDGDLISGEVTRYGAVPAADDEHAEWYRQGWEAGNKAARHVPAAEPDRPDPWIVVTDDCEACGALVGASHAANCVATEGAVPAAEPRSCCDEYRDNQAVPAADDRERMAALIQEMYVDGTLEPTADTSLDEIVDRILRAGVSPSTGDAERLHEAIRAVYYEDKHPDLTGGLTTDPADARLAAAILRRLNGG